MSWSIESVREANLGPSDVFRLYADPSTWGTWGHNTRWARAEGPVVEGATVHVKAGYGKVYPVRIRRLVVDRYIECEVRPVGLVVVNTYEVQPTPNGVRVRHRIEVSGRSPVSRTSCCSTSCTRACYPRRRDDLWNSPPCGGTRSAPHAQPDETSG